MTPTRTPDADVIAAASGRPYRIPLGQGPSPADVLNRLDRPGPTAALWGRWFGGGLLVLPDPMYASHLDRAEDAFDRLDQQPHLTGSNDPDLVGGGWLVCLGYAPGHSWVGFFDHLWRHQPENGWSFESLGLLGREDAGRGSLSLLRSLLSVRSENPRPAASTVAEPFAAAPGALLTHLRGVESVIAGIERGDFYQLNLCTRLRSRLRGSVERPGVTAELFAGLADRLRPSYGAMIDFGDGRSLVSMSPELFWRERSGRVQTKPIKGTTATAQDPTGAVLVASVKDAAENVMITDLMRNDLSRVCRPGTVTVERLLDLERHPGVWHLVSTVAGELVPGTGHEGLVRATFPPGSVTGAPKLSAMAGIAAVETETRGAYTGGLGLLTPRHGGELSVVIRTFEIDGDRIALGVGGGITVDSVGVREWYECLHKAEPLVRALGAELAPELRRSPPPVPQELRAAGLIETMLARDGNVLRLAAHLARLDRSCRELYGLGIAEDLVLRVREAAAPKETGTRARIRVRVGPDLTATVEGGGAGDPPQRIRLVRATRPDWCWRHKWAERSALTDPPVGTTETGALTLSYFLTPDGYLAESSRGNLCLLRSDGVWVSPPESEYVLPGVTRRDLLRELRQIGERVRIDEISPADLLHSRCLVHCSSVSGVVLVESLDDVHWSLDGDLDRLVSSINDALGFGQRQEECDRIAP